MVSYRIYCQKGQRIRWNEKDIEQEPGDKSDQSIEGGVVVLDKNGKVWAARVGDLGENGTSFPEDELLSVLKQLVKEQQPKREELVS